MRGASISSSHALLCHVWSEATSLSALIWMHPTCTFRLRHFYFVVRWLAQHFWGVFCCLFVRLSLIFRVNPSLHCPASFSSVENKPSQICIVAGCRLRSMLIYRRELHRFCKFFPICRVICEFFKLTVPFSQVFRAINASVVRNVESYGRGGFLKRNAICNNMSLY